MSHIIVTVKRIQQATILIKLPESVDKEAYIRQIDAEADFLNMYEPHTETKKIFDAIGKNGACWGNIGECLISRSIKEATPEDLELFREYEI